MNDEVDYAEPIADSHFAQANLHQVHATTALVAPALPPTDRPNGTIPKGVEFNGTVVGRNRYDIHGSFKGDITITDQDLIISDGAEYQGNVVAKNAVIAGVLNGKVVCSEGCVQFASTAKCAVELEYDELVVDRGAKVNAQLKNTGNN
nr:polymer-forming cytoskeletal protein [Hydrogenophaga aromaticivorans]